MPSKEETLQPLGKKVLLRKIIEKENKTESGIIIPDAVKQQVQKCIVVEKSANVEGFNNGDTVLLHANSGFAIDYKKEPHLLVNEDEIWAVIS